VFRCSETGHAGVPEVLFRLLKAKAVESAKDGVFDVVREDVPQKDAFWEGGLRARCTKIGQPEYICKTRVGQVVGTCPMLPNFQFVFHLKREEPREAKHFDWTKPPFRVRNQIVSEYKYKDTFLYTFKTVWQGATPEEACKSPERFEVEIELLHNTVALAEKSDTHIAQSLMLKTLGLCPNLNEDNVVQKLVMEWSSTKFVEATIAVPDPNADLEPTTELPEECKPAIVIPEPKSKKQRKNAAEPKPKPAPRPKKTPTERKPRAQKVPNTAPRVKKEPSERKPRQKKPPAPKKQQMTEEQEQALFQDALKEADAQIQKKRQREAEKAAAAAENEENEGDEANEGDEEVNAEEEDEDEQEEQQEEE